MEDPMNYNFNLKPLWLFILSLFLFHDVMPMRISMPGDVDYKKIVMIGAASCSALTGAYYVGKKIGKRRREANVYADKVGKKLSEISKWLNASKSVVMYNVVNQAHGNRWFNWRTKKPGASNIDFSWNSTN